MAIGYTEIDFLNGSAPALNATNLNKMDEAIKDACDLLDAETVAGRALVEAANAAAQRTALGLGDSATLDVGTGAGDVAAGNAPAGAVTTHESTYAHANIPTADEKTRLSDIQAASGATTAAKLVTLVNPTATQTASRIPLYNAAKGLNADGISFPSTQAPSADANTLDDYEEGTWTPTLIGSTTAGTQTYTSQHGFYTKIGRTVHITAFVAISAKDAAMAGNVLIGAIPFPIENTTGVYVPGVIRQYEGFTFAAGHTQLMIGASANSSIISLYTGGSTKSTGVITTTDIAETTSIMISMTYIA